VSEEKGMKNVYHLLIAAAVAALAVALVAGDHLLGIVLSRCDAAPDRFKDFWR